jgi:hypothetical protein
MSHLSGRDTGLSDLLLDCSLERATGECERAAGGDLDSESGVELGEGWVEDPRVSW